MDRGAILDRFSIGQLATLTPAGAFSVVGLVVALRRSENPAGWFMLVIGAGWSLVVFPGLEESGGS